MTTKLPLRSYYYLFGARSKDLNKNLVTRIDLLLQHVGYFLVERPVSAIVVHQTQSRPALKPTSQNRS